MRNSAGCPTRECTARRQLQDSRRYVRVQGHRRPRTAHPTGAVLIWRTESACASGRERRSGAEVVVTRQFCRRRAGGGSATALPSAEWSRSSAPAWIGFVVVEATLASCDQPCDRQLGRLGYFDRLTLRKMSDRVRVAHEHWDRNNPASRGRTRPIC